MPKPNGKLDHSTDNTDQSALGKRLWKSGLIVVVGRALGIAFSLGATLLLVRYLTKEDYGRYNLLVTSITIFSSFGRFGLDRIVLKAISEQSGYQKHRFAKLLLIKVSRVLAVTVALSSCLMVAILPLFPAIRECDDSMLLVILAVTSMIVMSILQMFVEGFRGFHDLLRATIYDSQRAGVLVATLFIFLIVVVASGSALTVLFAMLLFLLAQGAVTVIAAFDFWSGERASGSMVDIEEVSGEKNPQDVGVPDIRAGILFPLAGAEILAVLTGFGDIWLAATFLNAEELATWGVTSQVMQMVGVPLTMINMTVISTIPMLYHHGRTEELQRILQKAATVATGVSLIPLGLLTLVPGVIVSLVYGAHFNDAALPLMVVSVGKLILVWTGSCAYTLMLTGHQRIVLVNNLISFVTLFIMGAVATLQFGLFGLACVVTAVTIFSNLFNWIAAKSHAGVWTHATFRSFKSTSTGKKV